MEDDLELNVLGLVVKAYGLDAIIVRRAPGEDYFLVESLNRPTRTANILRAVLNRTGE
jgi:hypothetical protein